MNAKKTVILDAKEMERAIVRMTHEILEKNKDISQLVIVGIKTRGEFIAKRIARTIYELEKAEVKIGSLDITLHRDDLDKRKIVPVVQKTEIPFEIGDKNLVLVDDVLFSGRSVRAALDELIDFGRPARIQLAVLIDRGHRELPIRADFVGKNIPTALEEEVLVRMKEVDPEDEVLVVKK